MTVARSVSDVLAEHVVFEVDCIDRMYLNVYVPQLQFARGLVGYVHRQLGLPVASAAPLAKITDAFSAAVHRFARDHGVPWVDFAKGQRKDDVMHEQLARFTAAEGVVFVGRAQEKTPLFRTEKRRDAHGDAYPWIVKSTGLVNQFYFYCLDADFGPFFLKFCSYFPYNAKLCINGNEWAKRQAAKAEIGFEPLDNGFAAVDDPTALQAICDRLGPDQIDALLRKWLARLPHPFSPADRAAGYRYDISILQAEFSLTQMLDKPVSGQVTLIFDRKLIRRGPHATPGRFRTRVITDGVTPSLHVDYKHTRIKQYHKQGRALRTETTINDTHDFSIGKRLTNLPALREIGSTANRRLLRVQSISHDPITGTDALQAITAPVTTAAGTRIPGLRLGEQRSHALLAAFAAVPTPAQRLRQQRSPHADRRPAGSPRRAGHRGPDHLRPAATPRPRPHRPHPPHSPIHHHRPGPAHRDVPLRCTRPIPADRLGAPRRPRHLPTTACSLPRIPNRPRNPQPHNRTRRLTPPTTPENTKLDSKIRLCRIETS